MMSFEEGIDNELTGKNFDWVQFYITEADHHPLELENVLKLRKGDPIKVVLAGFVRQDNGLYAQTAYNQQRLFIAVARDYKGKHYLITNIDDMQGAAFIVPILSSIDPNQFWQAKDRYERYKKDAKDQKLEEFDGSEVSRDCLFKRVLSIETVQRKPSQLLFKDMKLYRQLEQYEEDYRSRTGESNR